MVHLQVHTDLPDLVSGNGLSGGPYDGAVTKTFSVSADGTTLAVGANGSKSSRCWNYINSN